MCGQLMDASMLGVRIVSNYYSFLWANRVCPVGPTARALIRATCTHLYMAGCVLGKLASGVY